MLRAVCLTAALAAPTATGFGQPRPPAGDCSDRFYTDRNRASHCETREESFAGSGLLDVDGSPNGGIRVHGWDRTDIHLVAQITAVADSDTRARAIADAVRIETGGRVRANGPDRHGRN